MFTKLVLILLILQPMTSLAESHLEDAEPDPRSRLIRLVLMELRRQENNNRNVAYQGMPIKQAAGTVFLPRQGKRIFDAIGRDANRIYEKELKNAIEMKGKHNLFEPEPEEGNDENNVAYQGMPIEQAAAAVFLPRKGKRIFDIIGRDTNGIYEKELKNAVYEKELMNAIEMKGDHDLFEPEPEEGNDEVLRGKPKAGPKGQKEYVPEWIC